MASPYCCRSALGKLGVRCRGAWGEAQVNHKANLLDQLRIERPAETARGGIPRAWVIGGGAAVLLLLFVFGFTLFGSKGIPVQVATARAATPASASGGASLLDASGYVVARRQATVSAKVLGKVIEVPIQEGQRVEANQIIARLDDSNAQAALAQSRALVEQAEAKSPTTTPAPPTSATRPCASAA